MNAEALTARSLEGLKLMVNTEGTHDVHEVVNMTVETNMKTGEAQVILIIKEEPNHTGGRDYEPHPGFPEINEWLYGREF